MFSGGGQGYLSSILALQHKKKTLSLDYNQVNTHGAAVRSKKLEVGEPDLIMLLLQCTISIEHCESTMFNMGP